MRTIPAAAQTKLETDLGTEIIMVLEIMWAGSSNSLFYSDKEIANSPVQAKILNLPSFEELISVSGGNQSQQIPVTIDDTDGQIKQIFDTNNVHKVPVRVWFYVVGTSWATDKFSVFLGQINSPVSWSEGNRTFSLSVLNRIEDAEIGFSAEEGQFPSLAEDLIGKPWPLCFGTTINTPALKAVPSLSGVLASGVGIKDFTLVTRLALANAITCPLNPVGFKCDVQSGAGQYSAVCNLAYEEDASCLQQKCVEIERLSLQLEEQTSYEYSSITVFGGYRFPQGRTITLNINGGLFTGFFDGTTDSPSETFRIQSRRHPKDDGTGGVIQDAEQAAIRSACPGTLGTSQDSDFIDTSNGPVYTGLKTSRLSWQAYRDALSADFFWAGGGQTVTLQDASEIVYIANILPSTILRVAAWRTINGNRYLLSVPSEFYTTRQTDYGGYNVMEIVFERPLSAEQQDTGGGWSDDIYVTQISSVGPNPVDIMEWFIDTYTDYAKDTASFAATRTKLDTYSMHVPFLTRKNLLAVLQEVATQARCALWLKNDTFYIKYLSETPTPVAAIGEDDILRDDNGIGSLVIELTKTEDLVTKLTAKWQYDYSLSDQNTLILRHNVAKYGTQEKTVDYYCYHHLDWVRKTATYWLIRWSNTWKRIKFSTSLEFMKLEAFDAVTFTLPDVATSSFVGIIERCELDTEKKQINFEAWCPVRAGEMTPYVFAWPAYISENALFPTIEAKNANLAGSGKEPNFSTIAPPGHPLRSDTTGVYQGASLNCNGRPVTSFVTGECRQDHGDSNPSDTGDVKQGVNVAADGTGNISGGTSPITNGAGGGYWSNLQGMLDALNKASQDASKGRETAQRAADASGANDSTTRSGSDFRDYVENLPAPEDLDPDTYPCQIQCKVSGFLTEEQGTRPICAPASPPFEEYVVFNSRTAANDFCEAIKADSNCGVPPCNPCVNCQITVLAGGANCEPDSEDEQAMIGYKKTGLGSGDDRSFFLP